MSVELTWFGHSAVLVQGAQHAVLVDPFITDNPAATVDPGDITCTHVALTHGHEDHFGDAIEIAKANDAPLIGAYEITNFVSSQGHEKVEPGNPGGKIELGDGNWVAFTQAFHSSSYHGQYMGMPCGLVIQIDGKRIYHLGDTGIFSDMALLGEIYQPDVALIPIGDRFTMGPELASRAADMIGATVSVPIHYGTWPPIEVDPEHFQSTRSRVQILQPGESMTVG
ncbi:MAG: metal-dependent hydrolase [Phycisphaerales bacterium]|nr:metal-dependent hydrolase [Phycisphaerales bacterium]